MYDIKEGFLRQRRNLMAITVIMFLSYFWDVDFKTINILGNTIDLNQGNNVFAALWIFFLYWSWRYRNYMLELGELGITKTLNDTRYRLFKQWLDKNGKKDIFWKKASYTIRGEGQIEPSDIDKIRLDPPKITIFQRSVKLLMSFTDNPNPWRGDNITVDFVMSWLCLLTINYKAARFLINDTRLFSEYVLPPLLALAFVIYWLWWHFLPSLLN